MALFFTGNLLRVVTWSVLLFLFGASAAPKIDVALQASFSSAPYLLELLETAAEENHTAYFPLLDRVAEGHFAKASTDQDLYDTFLQLLQDDGHLANPDTLASFQLALSLHAAAPRVEAHYQLYRTAIKPTLSPSAGDNCTTWVHFHGHRYCSPTLHEPHSRVPNSPKDLQLDRVLNPGKGVPSSVLYADILDPGFAHFHKILSKSAREGKTSYRVRYTPSKAAASRPLSISGYGVELALKRTDYIVIDDRDAQPSSELPGASEGEKPDRTDLRPLSKSDVAQLGLKTASFILESSDPFGSLVDVVQDFPLHSSTIASSDVSEAVLETLRRNQNKQDKSLPPGYDAFWINGVQLDNRQIDAHTLLQHLRRERRLITQLQSFGLSGAEAVNLLIRTSTAKAKALAGPQRFDFRDDAEEGKVIIWLNNIEKDKRYKSWPSSLAALRQRTYPGQLPSVRRDVHNMIVPVDLSNADDLTLIVGQLRSFVQRSIPIRFGLVPAGSFKESEDQARVVYHLLESYGLPVVIAYLNSSLESKQIGKPHQSAFDAAIRDQSLRGGFEPLTLQQVLDSENLNRRPRLAQQYIRRLGAGGATPPVFVNGVPIPRTEEWLSAAVQRVNLDLRSLQEGIVQGRFEDNAWLPNHFLSQAASKRNTLIVPEDEEHIEYADLGTLLVQQGLGYHDFPYWKPGGDSSQPEWAHLTIITDYSTAEGQGLLNSALQAHAADSNVEVALLHNPNEASDNAEFLRLLERGRNEWPTSPESYVAPAHDLATPAAWQSMRAALATIGIDAGQNAVLLNGRLIGPIPSTTIFDKGDFVQLLEYERVKRSRTIYGTLAELGLDRKVSDHAAGAKLVSIVASSEKSDVPEGIFEASSNVRMNVFEEWDSTCAITVGDPATALLQIVAAVDPASETAQRWIPIVATLSQLQGVYVKLFMNPREKLEELPVKRFYRYVLQSSPSFNADGSVQTLSAQFEGLPAQALLTMGMDVAPSWLVMPKESVHDLDNIKLDSVRDGHDVHALYELEHILIEGHSRDVTSGQPPRGAQLMLGTETHRHLADTIVMANLGYFQFKANPGLWRVDLLPGRSQEVYSIDSAGTKGYAPQPGDESPEIELLTFQGTTLFPRLSRNPGREKDDVLEASGTRTSVLAEYASQGVGLAQKLLSKVGVRTKSQHADINIFSVASGHLYERMLNIMMVSVMKHTTHTVKFWFIEQFLSPSFKQSIPLLAAEYHFDYEMVTYKWPHWLRAQREKQREIWGYKILFLDVLFPLSLDKVIFVDADQIVRTDMFDLVEHDLKGAAYGFTPMCDSRTEMEGFRFWKQGYWHNYLRGLPYHISALYVVDLRKFRQIAAGDRLRQQYHQLSADPNSLSNLDQDLPNHMQHTLPIHSLPQEWLWCETWCSDEALASARTIDLCNNPMTKEPKLDRARRQVPEWTIYDEEIHRVIQRRRGEENSDEAELDIHTTLLSSPSSLSTPSPQLPIDSRKDEL
ncbi:MAG: RNA polymerase I enhancer binding protein [Watsoniomyces obsoletus]|nr:MAG: RNA polymerase I enhancer binding protein [Watsoniomyces obsoletus]